MAFDDYHAWRKAVAEFAAEMQGSTDYGRWEGLDKDILLKPGAEKFALAFGLTVELDIIQTIEDFESGLVHYVVKGRALRGGEPFATGFGSCNSREPQYRYRQRERLCPGCGQPTIRRSKYEDDMGEKGWYCWSKIGGCGSEFPAMTGSITDQVVGSVPNPDIAATYNTVLKIAAKRAYVDTVIRALGLSDLFTQDEELAVTGPTSTPPKQPQAGQAETPSPAGPQGDGDKGRASKSPKSASGSTTVMASDPESVRDGVRRKVTHYIVEGATGDFATDDVDLEMQLVGALNDVPDDAEEIRLLQFLFGDDVVEGMGDLTEAQGLALVDLLAAPWADKFLKVFRGG